MRTKQMATACLLLALMTPVARGGDTCSWDCADGDGYVGIREFLAVIGLWGVAGVSCDFDGGGVGFQDFMKVFEHWGPCPECEGNEECDDGDPCTIDSCLDGKCVTIPSEGDCCASNGSPGCDNAECCGIVCASDPFCCDTTWDEFCAGDAANKCSNLCGGGGGGDPECGDKDAGDCCSANGTTGCDDSFCCDFVCSIDAYCCDVEWDQMCADTAAVTCVRCG